LSNYSLKREVGMNENESWESKCCRCEGDTNLNPTPGKRACHLTCGPCQYPEDWGKCMSCELVGHCTYALAHLRALKVNKGCLFNQQLTGEESLYHVLNFVNGQQPIIKHIGEKEYFELLRKENPKNTCLQKETV
jgi:hypothetical protein